MNLGRNVRLLEWHEFFVSFVLWGPIAILYFSRISGSYALGLSVFSAVMLTSAIFELPTGILSDFVGRKKTMVFGAISYIIGFVLYALGGNYLFLLLGALFEGIARSFYSGNNEALLYDSLEQSNRKHELSSVMGKIGSMGQWALAVAGLLGGFIANWSFQWVMWIAVIPQVICLILSLMIIDTKTFEKEESNIYSHLRESFKNFLSSKKLRMLSLADILGFGMGEASFQFRSAFIASLWPIWAIGIAQIISNIGAAISFRFAGKMINKFKAITWLITGGIYSKIVYLVALFIPSIFSPALMSTTSIFYGVGQVAKKSLLQQEFSSKQRATMGSLNSLVGSIFFAIFAVLLGYFADLTNPRVALIGVTIAQFITIWIYFQISGKESKSKLITGAADNTGIDDDTHIHEP